MRQPSLLQSFRHAWEGVRTTFLQERNFRLHVLATVLVVLAGSVMGLSRMEWLAIGGAIALMMTSELFNTSLEKICDAVTLEKHPYIKLAKDAAAGACLVMACFCLLVGGVIFLPKFL